MKSINNKISVIIHGQIRNETQKTIDSVIKLFPESEIILSVADSDTNIENLNTPKNINIIRYKEPLQFNDYGFFSRNYIRHCFGFYNGIKLAKNDLILKVRSDIDIKNIVLSISDLRFINIKYFNFINTIRPILVYPFYKNLDYFNGDMVIFGYKKELELLFCTEENKFLNLSSSSIFPELMPSIKKSYMAPEEILYRSYVRNILSSHQDMGFEEVLGNRKPIIDLKKIILPLNIDCKVPKRIGNYIFSFRAMIINKFRYSQFFLFIYSQYRKTKKFLSK